MGIVRFNVTRSLYGEPQEVGTPQHGLRVPSHSRQRHQPAKAPAHMPGLSRVPAGAGQGCSFSAKQTGGPRTFVHFPRLAASTTTSAGSQRCHYVQVAVLGNCHHRDQDGPRHHPQAFPRPAAGATPRPRRARECRGRHPALSALLPLWRIHRRRVHEPELVSTH